MLDFLLFEQQCWTRMNLIPALRGTLYWYHIPWSCCLHHPIVKSLSNWNKSYWCNQVNLQVWAVRCLYLSLRPWTRVYGSAMKARNHSFILKCLFLNIPNHPIFVFSTANHIFSCSVEIKLPNCWLMSLDSVCAEPIVNWVFIFPAFNRVIIACREKNILFWVPFHKFNILSVSTSHRNTIVVSIFSLIISLSDPDSFISTASCEPFSIWTPWYTFNFIFMAFKLLYTFKSAIS